jgi:SAM-dependent methyltransferase
MTNQTTYSLFARFYDAYVGDYDRDIPLYLGLAAACRAPVVEVGCGSGRVLLPLLRAGHTITGVDISDEMLLLAKAKLESAHWSGKCRLLHHNFVDGALPEKYGLALVTYYTFNYLLASEDQRALLRHIADSLEPGARIGLHLFCPSLLSRPEMAGQWIDKGAYRVGGEDVHLRDRRRMLDDCTEERIQVFTDGSGSREEIRTLRRYVTGVEMAGLLLASGFGSPLVTRDFNLNSLAPVEDNRDAPGEFLVVAERQRE